MECIVKINLSTFSRLTPAYGIMTGKTVRFCTLSWLMCVGVFALITIAAGFNAVQANESIHDVNVSNGQEIGTPYIYPDGAKKRSSFTVLSPDGKRIYTLFRDRIYEFQIKPFKLLHDYNLPAGIKTGRGFGVFLTGDEKYMVLTAIPNKIILYDFRREKIVQSVEIKDQELMDSVLNGNDLVVFSKDSNLEAYKKKHPGADRDDFLNQPGNFLIYDVYGLKQKSNSEFYIDNDSPHSVFLAGLHIFDDYISLFRRQYQQSSWVFLDRNTYKPRLVFLVLANESSRVSPDLQNIYMPNVYDSIFFNPHPSYAVSADGKVSLFPAKYNVWFSLKDKQFIDPDTNNEQVKKLEQSPFLFSPGAYQLSKAGDYIAYTGARIFDLKTKQIFSLYQFENNQAILIERTTGHFAMTKHARKHLTMKTNSGDIVPINDATFNQFNLNK